MQTVDRVGSVWNVTQTLIVQIFFCCYFLYLCRVLLKLLFTKNGRTEHFCGKKLWQLFSPRSTDKTEHVTIKQIWRNKRMETSTKQDRTNTHACHIRRNIYEKTDSYFPAVRNREYSLALAIEYLLIQNFIVTFTAIVCFDIRGKRPVIDCNC